MSKLAFVGDLISPGEEKWQKRDLEGRPEGTSSLFIFNLIASSLNFAPSFKTPLAPLFSYLFLLFTCFWEKKKTRKRISPGTYSHNFFRRRLELMYDFESEIKFIHSSFFPRFTIFFNTLIAPLRQMAAEGCDMDARHSAAVATSFVLTRAGWLKPAGPLIPLPLALFSGGGGLLKALTDWDAWGQSGGSGDGQREDIKMKGCVRDGTAEGIVGFKFQRSHSCCVVRVRGGFPARRCPNGPRALHANWQTSH